MKHLLVACALMVLVALSAACMEAWLPASAQNAYHKQGSADFPIFVVYPTLVPAPSMRMNGMVPTVQVIGPDCQCPSNMLPVLSVDNSMDKFKICVGPR